MVGIIVIEQYENHDIFILLKKKPKIKINHVVSG